MRDHVRATVFCTAPSSSSNSRSHFDVKRQPVGRESVNVYRDRRPASESVVSASPRSLFHDLQTSCYTLLVHKYLTQPRKLRSRRARRVVALGAVPRPVCFSRRFEHDCHLRRVPHLGPARAFARTRQPRPCVHCWAAGWAARGRWHQARRRCASRGGIASRRASRL